jgi:signal peptidase I
MSQSGEVSTPAWRGGLFEAAKTIFWAALFAIGIHTFLFQPFWIPSGSMVPTLEIHDYLFVNKFVYGYANASFPFGIKLFPGRLPAGMPKRGDVVVLAPTQGAGTEDLVKRVIGLPGDTVQVQGGLLYINGQPVALKDEGQVDDDSDGFPFPVEKYAETLPGGVVHPILKISDDGAMNNTPLYTVPPKNLFLMGDNRDNSLDSRALDDLGYVPVANVVGKAELIFFSIDLTSPWYDVWNWPVEIRWNRLLRPIS